MENGAGVVIALMVVLLSLAVPFIPTIIALARDHARAGTIAGLNFVISFALGIPLVLMTGGIGGLLLFPFWAWILVWAIMGEKRKLPDYRQLATEQAMARKWKQLKA
jgi:hypothetical protein